MGEETSKKKRKKKRGKCWPSAASAGDTQKQMDALKVFILNRIRATLANSNKNAKDASLISLQ